MIFVMAKHRSVPRNGGNQGFSADNPYLSPRQAPQAHVPMRAGDRRQTLIRTYFWTHVTVVALSWIPAYVDIFATRIPESLALPIVILVVGIAASAFVFPVVSLVVFAFGGSRQQNASLWGLVEALLCAAHVLALLPLCL